MDFLTNLGYIVMDSQSRSSGCCCWLLLIWGKTDGLTRKQRILDLQPKLAHALQALHTGAGGHGWCFMGWFLVSLGLKWSQDVSSHGIVLLVLGGFLKSSVLLGGVAELKSCASCYCSLISGRNQCCGWHAPNILVTMLAKCGMSTTWIHPYGSISMYILGFLWTSTLCVKCQGVVGLLPAVCRGPPVRSFLLGFCPKKSRRPVFWIVSGGGYCWRGPRKICYILY